MSSTENNLDKDFVHIPETHTVVQPVEKPIIPQIKKRAPIIRFIAWCVFIIVIVAIGMGVYTYKTLITPYSGVQAYPFVIDIPSGSNLNSVTQKLVEQHVISSPTIFRLTMLVTGQESSVKSGEYTFKGPLSTLGVIEKLVRGRYEYDPVKLIIREGEDAKTIAKNIIRVFPKWNESEVYEKLKAKEGYVFPETYSFAPFADIDEILKTTTREFDKRIARFDTSFASTTQTKEEILTIASILEKEVPREVDMKMVAGIIYNRLAKGMPLQMDSTVGYITGKASLELVIADLKIDSPYNTYVAKGLPPSPIGNPGEASIRAALYPEKHDFLFFLSDKDGVNHYAKTYAEHLKNRRVYLGK